MISLLDRIKTQVKTRPGFYLLLLIISIIIGVTIKPGFYLLGWDNYSSYFNIPNNIFQTFFATWREYRGLGVPSDSEATDLFRQIFYFVFHLFTPEQLLDQIYDSFAFFVGAVSMYFLANRLFQHIAKESSLARYADWFGFFAAFFYIFNLNTLSTFYFPMIMYVNRFFMLPVIFSLIYVLLSKKITKKAYAFILFAFLFSSGAFLTATIFITLLIGLVLYGLSVGNIKRYTLIFILLISTQLFWLLPFFNYAVQKSKIIPLAPAYITTNEVQLNKAQNYYSLDKILTLYPSFFDTQFSDIDQTKQLNFHPLAVSFNNLSVKSILLIFPLLYVLGSVFIIAKKRWRAFLIWVPTAITLFIFLTMKEFSALGFLYGFLDAHIPYFGILFRFGDTKFEPMIAFAGSIAAALAIIEIVNLFRKRAKYISIGFGFLVIAFTIGVFSYYFTGSLISSYKYVKIPPLYKDIAQIINRDPDNSRVLQLPSGKEDYWKSYEWGMFGSAFLNFMLDHPIFDKTFEPASQENVAVDSKIDQELANFQQIQDPLLKKEKARSFASLLQTVGVKYLVYDNSVQSTLYPRGVLLWQKFNSADSQAMVDELVLDGFGKEIKRYNIDLADYAITYSQFHKLTPAQYQKLLENRFTYVSLLQLNSPVKEISFIDNAESIDPRINFIASSIAPSEKHVLQDPDSVNFATYPFNMDSYELGSAGDSFTLKTKLSDNFSVMSMDGEPASQDSMMHFLDVSVGKDENMLTIDFAIHFAPGIGGIQFVSPLAQYQIPLSDLGQLKEKKTPLSDYVSDWSILDMNSVGPLRLRIGDYILPIPDSLPSSPKKVGTVAVVGNKIPLEILTFDKETTIDPKDIVITQNPNCFRDKLPGASFSVSQRGKEMDITNQNQSLCFVAELQRVLSSGTGHAEINLLASGESADLDPKYTKKIRTSKQDLTSYITNLPKPSLLRLCAKQPNTNDCYNLHQFVNVDGDTKAIFPLERALGSLTDLQLLLSLKNNGYQAQKINIKHLSVDTFITKSQTEIEIPAYSALKLDVPSINDRDRDLTIPKALSLYSFYFNPKKEGLYGFNPACEDKNGYRTFRTFEDKLISYVSGCYIEAYANVPFISKNFSLWDVSYNLLSGKFPRFIIDDGFYSYVDSFLSLDQGYPSVSGFRKFQAPEGLFSNMSSAALESRLENIKTQDAYGFIPALPELPDSGAKNITIHQDSENEGIMLLSHIFIQPLPTQWENLQLTSSKFEDIEYKTPEEFSFNRILPSLWKVSVKTANQGQLLLKFNEGYDSQWRAYDSVWGIITGLGKSYKSVKCDGYANCFQISQKGIRTYYLFYTPERLSIGGWILGIIGVLFIARFLIYPRLSSKKSFLETESHENVV